MQIIRIKYLCKISLLLEPLFVTKGNQVADFYCIDRQNVGISRIFEEKGNLRCKKICIDPWKGIKGSIRTNLFAIDLRESFLRDKTDIG